MSFESFFALLAIWLAVLPAALLAAPQAAVDQFFLFWAERLAGPLASAELLVQMLLQGVTTRYYLLLPVTVSTGYHPSLAQLAGNLQATCTGITRFYHTFGLLLVNLPFSKPENSTEWSFARISLIESCPRA